MSINSLAATAVCKKVLAAPQSRGAAARVFWERVLVSSVL